MPLRPFACFLVTWLALLLSGCMGSAGHAETAADASSSERSEALAPEAAAAPEGGTYQSFDGAAPSLPSAAVPPEALLAQAPPSASPGDKKEGGVGASPGAAAGAPDPSAAVPDAATGPLLIYTAHLHLAVFEVQKALAAAEQLARGAKGYIVKQSDQGITFRVPADQFQAVLEQSLKLGDIIHRNVQARDVTEEFFDVQTRLRTLEAMRDRLEQLLARAQKVEEALAVERELGRVVEEIERVKGRLKLLRELIAFSTITLEFQPRAVESLQKSVPLPFPWLRTLGLGPLLTL